MKPFLSRAFVTVLLLTGSVSFAYAENNDARGTDQNTPVVVSPTVQKKAMISGYHFILKGHTSERAIRSRIVPDGDEIFDSEAALVAALDNKAQVLKNLRIFRSVQYTYTYTNESSSMQFYQVEFTIVDGGAKLPFPYAKYDSNYGLKAGVRLYDKNLLGQMADLYLNADIEQNDNSFEKATYFGEVDVNKIMLSPNIQMDIASSFNLNEDEPDNSYFKFDVRTRGLKIDKKPLSLREWIQVAPQKNESGVYKNTNTWKFEEIGNTINFGPFAMDLGGYSISNTIIDYHDKAGTGDHERLQTYTSLAFHGFKVWGKQLDCNINVATTGYEDGILNKLRIGETAGMNFTFGGWMNWYNSLSQFNTMYPKNGVSNPHGHILYETSLALYSSLSHSNINYVTDDFRSGLDFRFTYRNEIYLFDEYDGLDYIDYTYQNFAFQLTCFWYPADWINPSIRITGGINHYHTPASNGNHIPNDRYFYPDATGDSITEYIRGVRDDNDYARTYKRTDTGDKIYDWERSVVVNINMTTKFIKLGNFAHTLINPFLDLAVFKREASPDYESLYNHSGIDCVGDWECLWGIGMEGIGIIDSHPAYPVRLSIGINGGDIFHKIKGDLSGGIEYEIYFGMYHFF